MNSDDTTSDLDNILSKLEDAEKEFVYTLITRDPLADLYNKGVVACVVLLVVLVLWPFDFVFREEKNDVHWFESSNGIEFGRKGQVLSSSSTRNLCGRLLAGTGFSLEVWAAAQNALQSGPARIVSYSLNPSLRNFTLGQSKKNMIIRLRTTKTNLNGTKPHLVVDNVFDSSDPKHIVVNYDFSQQNVYINGERRARKEIPGGIFSNWDPSYHLVLGNEATGQRPWRGKIFFVAIYNRVLDKQEIRQNYRAGWFSAACSGPKASDFCDGLVAGYLFAERKGYKISDSSGTHTPLDLHIPRSIQIRKKAYLDFSNRSFFQNADLFRDVILNVLAFVPVAFLLHAALRTHHGASLKMSAFVFIIGTLFTFGIESLQHFSLTRHSSLMDMFSNMLGTVLGITIDKSYATFLKSQRKFLQAKTY